MEEQLQNSVLKNFPDPSPCRRGAPGQAGVEATLSLYHRKIRKERRRQALMK